MSADNEQPVIGVIQGLILAERERCAKIVKSAAALSECHYCDFDDIIAEIRSGE